MIRSLLSLSFASLTVLTAPACASLGTMAHVSSSSETGSSSDLGDSPSSSRSGISIGSPASHAVRSNSAAEDYVTYDTLDPIIRARDVLVSLSDDDLRSHDPDNAANIAERARVCIATIKDFEDKGVDMEKPRNIGHGQVPPISLAAARTEVCDALLKRSQSYAADVKKSKETYAEETSAPFKKAGITGDRLSLMVEHVNYAMYGVGGGTLSTPAQKKKAAVIFELLGPNTDTGLYTLRRYQFKGDSLVSTTSEDYKRRPGGAAYR